MRCGISVPQRISMLGSTIMHDVKTVLHVQCGQPIFLFCGDSRYLYKLDKNEIMNFEGMYVPIEHIAICNQCGNLLSTNDLVLKSELEIQQNYVYYTSVSKESKDMLTQQNYYNEIMQMQMGMDKLNYAKLKEEMYRRIYGGNVPDFTIVNDKIKL